MVYRVPDCGCLYNATCGTTGLSSSVRQSEAEVVVIDPSELSAAGPGSHLKGQLSALTILFPVCLHMSFAHPLLCFPLEVGCRVSVGSKQT